LHGGVICTLADIAAVACAVSGVGALPVGGATANLSISFLARAEGQALLATGQMLRGSSRQQVMRVGIADATGCAIAEALVTVILSFGNAQNGNGT
jgi:uncharacterized protein (TIGR00369 family)